jgi:pimeloyl-ACP methyl ester carboxylesterase
MDYCHMAEDIKYYIDNNQLKNVGLIGHSMGGKVVMQFLSKHGDYNKIIEKAVVIDILPINYLGSINGIESI